MAVSYGYTVETAENVSMKIPPINEGKYVLDKANTDDFSSRLDRVEDTPTNQQERITIKARPVNSVQISQGLAYKSRVKSGYMFSVKNENILRVTDADGMIYDEPVKVTITCETTNGAYVEGGLVTGADWLAQILRCASFIIDRTNTSGTTTVDTAQKQIDILMHGKCKKNPVRK